MADLAEPSSTRRPSGEILSVAPAPSDPPPGFVAHVFEHRWTIGRPRAAVWEWLCDPATFIDGQIPPYRVEFLSGATGSTGFEPGVYNAHVGPACAVAIELWNVGAAVDDASRPLIAVRLGDIMREVDNRLRDLASFIPVWERGVGNRRALMLNRQRKQKRRG